MKKIALLFVFFVNYYISIGQNVGIGTITPSSKLEIRDIGNTVVKISGTSLSDTSQLIFNNKSTTNTGTSMHLSSDRELGLRFFSSSDLQANTRDSIMQITPQGNVGIGIKTPLEKLHVNGSIRSSGMHITGVNDIEFGFGLIGKEINAGKIGYALFSPMSLDITGAGTASLPRRIRLWAEGGTTLEGPLNVTNINSYTGLTNDEINVNAYTKLGGSTSPAIKTKVLYGVFGAFNSGSCTDLIAHGLDPHQILSANVNVEYDNTTVFYNSSTQNVVIQHYYNGTYFDVRTTNSILAGKKIQIFITYKESITWP